MKKLVGILSVLLLAAVGHAQTGSLIAHGIGTQDPVNPIATFTLTGASAANSIMVVTHQVDSITDTDGHSYVKIIDQNGYDTWTQVWFAAGVTISSSDTITVHGNYTETRPLVMAFSIIASLDKFHSFGNTNTSDNPILSGVITPTNPNEVVIGIAEGTFNATPTWDFSGSTPSGWSAIDTVQTLTGYENGADYVFREGSGTPAAAQFSMLDNSFNGHMSLIMAFASTSAPLPLTIGPSSLPHGMRTAPYPQTVTNPKGPYPPICFTPAGGAAPYTVVQTGTLPPGLTWNSTTNCVGGTPTTTGTYSGIVVTVTDNQGTVRATPSMSIVIDPLTTIMDFHHPYTGFVVMPGAKRQFGVMETFPGATGKVDYSIPEGAGFATLSCTTNCPGTVGMTVTGTAGNCSIAGPDGNRSVTGGTDFHVVATSRDTNEDGSHSTDSIPVHICKGDHLADTQPAYLQAFTGQNKSVYGAVMGQLDQAGTWDCTAPDTSSCNSALDIALPTGSGAGTKRHNRDVVFTAPSTVGRYKITFCSISTYDGTTTACNYSWVYVAGAAPAGLGGTTQLPLNADGTEAIACAADPAFGSRSYTVKADGTGTYRHLYELPLNNSSDRVDGFLARVFNLDTTGTNPTQYADWIFSQTGGTRDRPVHFCGVLGGGNHMPIPQANGMSNPAGSSDAIIKVGRFPGANPIDYDGGTGPDYVNITGFNIQDAGATTNNRVYGIYIQDGRHISIEGNRIEHFVDNIFTLNNTLYLMGRHTSFFSIIGNWLDHCGSVPGYGDHCTYTQAAHNVIVGNHYGTIVPGGSGSWIKDRGSDSIVAFNSFSGSAGYTNMWWPESSDDAWVEGLDMFLGQPGDTSCGSWYCQSVGSGLADWRHIMDNEEALSHTAFFGNTLRGDSAPFFNFGAGNSDGCGAIYTYCTLTDDHAGEMLVWNNDFDRGSVVALTNNAFYNNGSLLTGIMSWPIINWQNNAMWTDGSQGTFLIDMSPASHGKFTTNLFATGTVSIASPILPGNTGWGNSPGGGGTGVPTPLWSAYSPKDSYQSGIASANFLFTPTMPYDGTTYLPTTGSPLIGAGTAITHPEMALLPLRYEPDPVNGFMVPRADGGITIGARSSGLPVSLTVTTTSLPSGGVGVAYSVTLTAIGGTAPYTWSQTGGALPAGLSLNTSTGVISGTPTTAGTATGLVFRVTDSVAATANSPSMSVAIASAPTVTTSSLPNGAVGVNYSYTLTGTGGTPPYSWTRTSGTLPSAVILTGSTGALSGIPAASGTTTGLVFKLTDALGAQASSSSLSLAVTPAPPTVTTTILPSGTVGTAYNYCLTVAGGTSPFTWTQTGGTLPAGLALVSGCITGTPTAVGSQSGLIFHVVDSASQFANSPSLVLSIAAGASGKSGGGGKLQLGGKLVID